MDYESRLISRPLLYNSSALLAFSVLLQTTLPPRGYRDNLNAGHRRSEVVVRPLMTRAVSSLSLINYYLPSFSFIISHVVV